MSDELDPTTYWATVLDPRHRPRRTVTTIAGKVAGVEPAPDGGQPPELVAKAFGIDFWGVPGSRFARFAKALEGDDD